MHPSGWEIALIVLAVVLVFGVGKLSQVGGALGKSIREFRKEKDSASDKPQLTTKDSGSDVNINRVDDKSREQHKD